LSSESAMYHLLIERVSTVTSGFVQCRSRVRVEFNRAGIERVVGRTGLFTSLAIDICIRLRLVSKYKYIII
jgi:hypothetical protein